MKKGPMFGLFGLFGGLMSGMPAIHRTADASRINGANRHSGRTVAQDKRAALKARNRARHRRHT